MPPPAAAPVTAAAIAHAVRSGEVTATEIITARLAHIDSHDSELAAFNTVTATAALDAAARVDAQVAAGEDPGPLAGVPIAYKDNLCTNGVATTCSSRMLEGWLPPYDATVVARCAAAGAVMVGKTNLDEFAMGSSTENSAFGPTANPHDLGRVPGGSSGGSAAAVAAGFVPLALGSDTGGSIRQPAALCGTVGVKPTYGRVSRYGLIAFASSFDQVGPLTTSVADAALALDVIAGHDPADSTSIAEPVASHQTELERGVAGLRVGVVEELTSDADADVRAQTEAAADALSAAGAEVKTVSVDSVRYGLTAYYLIAPAEASSNLARFDGTRYGLRTEADDVEQMNALTRRNGFGAEVIARIMLGTFALSAGYYDAYYVKAQRLRRLTRRDFDAAYETCDVLISPTSPFVAFAFGDRDDPLSMYRCDTATIPSNLTGDPAVSVPFGTGDGGLPVGCQVMAPQLADGLALRVAAELERHAPPIPPPAISSDVLAPERSPGPVTERAAT